MSESRIELNGREPGIGELASLAQLNYGHFTSFRMDDGKVRGLGLHLQRLVDATRTLFGTELDSDRVRHCTSSATSAIRARPGGDDTSWYMCSSVRLSIRSPRTPAVLCATEAKRPRAARRRSTSQPMRRAGRSVQPAN